MQNVPIASADLRNYPNPFSQQSTIEFSSSEQGYAEISVVNLLGSEVAQVFSGELSAGPHEFTWNANEMPPGMYECVLRMNGRLEQMPMLLMR
jgi:flagellar hook assembly protein FlgD